LPPWRTLAARQRRRRSGVQTPSILFYVANNGQIQSLLSFRDKRSIELVCCRTFSCSAILASAGGWNVWIGRPETQHDNVVEAPTIRLECYEEKMIDENCRHALPKKTGATSRALLLALRVNVHFGANTPFHPLLWTSIGACVAKFVLSKNSPIFMYAQLLIPRCTYLSSIFVRKHIVKPFSCQITPLISLNFFEINLLPCINEAKKVQQYGSIYFPNVSSNFS
jgi:hypothetical protein